MSLGGPGPAREAARAGSSLAVPAQAVPLFLRPGLARLAGPSPSPGPEAEDTVPGPCSALPGQKNHL